jgi:hypothetical protein
MVDPIQPSQPGQSGQQGPQDLGAVGEHVPEQLHPVLRFLATNWKPIAAGVGLVLLLVGGVSAYRAYTESQRQDFAEQVGEAASVAEIPARIEALEALASEAPESMEPAVRLEIATAAAAAEDWERTVAAFGQLRDTSDVNLRTIAAIGAANALMKLDRYTEAATELERARSFAPETYEAVIVRNMAISAEKAENWDKALTLYKELEPMDEASQELIAAKIASLEQKTGNPES